MPRHSAVGAPRPAALLVGQIHEVFFLLAPCGAGAATASVLRGIYEMSSKRATPVTPPARRRLRVLVLMHDYLVPPDDLTGHDLATVEWKTEYDVLKTLRDDLQHEVRVLGVKDELGPIRQANEEFKPHIAFNL